MAFFNIIYYDLKWKNKNQNRIFVYISSKMRQNGCFFDFWEREKVIELSLTFGLNHQIDNKGE